MNTAARSISRILVTGGRGFVGRHLVAALATRHQDCDIVVGTSNECAHRHGDVYRTVAMDITDAGQVATVVRSEQPDCLIHLAASSAVSTSHRDVRRVWAVNLKGTLNVALAVTESAPQCRLVHISTSEVYGANFMAGCPLDEKAPFDPVNPYAASKAAADLLVGQMAKQILRAVRLRPFNHTGPGQSTDFVVPAFAAQIARIERGEQPPVIRVGNLEARRDFLDVDDVVDAYCRVVANFDELPTGCVINLASGRAVAIADILAQLIALSSVKIDVVEDASRLRPSDIPTAVGDATLARRLLDWSPRTDLFATLKSVLEYYRRARENED